MNQIATTERSTMASIPLNTGPTGSTIAPQSLGEVVRFAEVMCKADIALPKHLRGNAGACMAVAMQAMEWQMSPFAVASKSYAVNGAIAYEAQLIAAVVNTRSGIKGRLKYFFEGEGADMTCRVVGILDGEECEYRSPPIGSITTKNSPLWKSDPQQQLGYFSARSWARRHCPEVILGVYDREEVEHVVGAENARDVTPSLPERLAAAKAIAHEPASAREGFDRDFVARETQALSEGQEIDQEPASDHPPSPSETAGSASDNPTSPGLSDDATEPAEPVEAGAEGQEQSEPAPASEDRAACIKAFMRTATDKDLSIADRRDILEESKDWWKEKLPTDHDFVRACLTTADKVAKGELQEGPARKYLEGLL